MFVSSDSDFKESSLFLSEGRDCEFSSDDFRINNQVRLVLSRDQTLGIVDVLVVQRQL